MYTSLGIIIGIATFVAIITVAQAGQDKIYSELDKYGPNMVIVPAITDVGMKVGTMNLGRVSVGENYINESLIPVIQKTSDDMIRHSLNIRDEGDIVTIAPKLYQNVNVNGMEVMLVGIIPEKEILIKSWWEIDEGAYFENIDSNEVILGARISEILGLKTGDKIDLGPFKGTIKGTLKETGSQEDYQIFANLKAVQTVFNKEGKVSALDVRALCLACPVEEISGKLNQEILGIRAIAVKQIAKSEMSMMQKINNFMFALAVLTLLVSSLVVVNTMLTSVHERKKDIGIMRVVGASRWQIFSVFLVEAMVISLIGGTIGFFAGSLGALITGPLIFEEISVRVIPEFLIASLGLSAIISITTSLYPSYRASRVKIADVLKSL